MSRAISDAVRHRLRSSDIDSIGRKPHTEKSLYSAQRTSQCGIERKVMHRADEDWPHGCPRESSLPSERSNIHIDLMLVQPLKHRTRPI